MGVNSLGASRSPLPDVHTDNSHDDSGADKGKGLYTTFSFQDNEMPVSIGGTTTLAKIDSGSDYNVLS